MKNYIIQKGDTLCGIAKQFGTTANTLKEINNITDIITPGESILIPSTNMTPYIVKQGDSIYSIAQQYNITAEEIIAANNLNSTNLNIDQTLMIPLTTTISNNDDYIKYTVKEGDNLYEIAKKYNTTVDDIKELNNLQNDNLAINQTLIIKPNNTSTSTNNTKNTYTVKQGDSIYSIAKKFNTTPEIIIDINNLTSPLLTIGQQLIISNSSYIPSTSIKECFGTAYTPPSYEIYTVKKGDNLYSIAKKYGTTVDEIKSLNNLTSNSLEIGQKLNIKEI